MVFALRIATIRKLNSFVVSLQTFIWFMLFNWFGHVVVRCLQRTENQQIINFQFSTVVAAAESECTLSREQTMS